MLAKVLRWLLYSLLAVFILLLVVMGFIKLSPASLFPVIEKTTQLRVQSDELKFNYFPLRLEFEQLTVADTQKAEGLRLSLKQAVVQLDWWRAIRGKSPYWYLESEQGVLNLPEAGDKPSPKKQKQEAPQTAVDFNALFGFSHIRVSNFTVLQHPLTQQQPLWFDLDIKQLNPQLLDIKASFKQADIDLNFESTLAIKQQGGRSGLRLVSKSLDLSSVMSGKKPVESEVKVNEKKAEAALDWSWLTRLSALDLELQLAQLLLNEHQLQNLDVSVKFYSDFLAIDQLQATVVLPENKLTNQSDETLRLTGKITPLAKQTQAADALLELELNSASDAAIKAVIKGEANLNGVQGNNLEVAFQANHSRGFSPLLPDSLSAYFPIEMSAKLATQLDDYQVDNLKLHFADSDISGSVVAKKPNKWVVSGSLHSELLHLKKALQEEQSKKTDEQEKPPTTKHEGPKDLISDNPLDWSWLKTIDADIAVTANTLQVFDAKFDALTMKLVSKQGSWLLKPMSAQFGNGGFESQLSMSPKDEGVKVDFQYSHQGIDLEAFGLTTKEQLQGGVSQVAIALNAEGVSPQALASSLHGDILLTVKQATVMNDTFELIGSDLVMETLNKLNPFVKSDPTTELECALVHFEVDQGVLNSNKQLVVETTKLEIVGDGRINLNDETLDIGIVPATKQGIGLNVGSLVKFLKLGGTLAKPSPTVDAGGLLMSAASVGAAVSTGGLSVVAEGMVQKGLNAGNACEKALKPKDETSVEAEKSQLLPEQQETQPKPEANSEQPVNSTVEQ